MSLAMTREQREKFLAGLHVGVIAIPDGAGRGPLTAIEPVRDAEAVRVLARRYLGTKGGDAYVAATWEGYEKDPNVRVRIRPERWLTVDYARMASQLARED